jgi:hypothetical protein
MISVLLVATLAICGVLDIVVVPTVGVVLTTTFTEERVVLVATLAPQRTANCVCVVVLMCSIAILTTERTVVAIDRVIITTRFVLWDYGTA